MRPMEARSRVLVGRGEELEVLAAALEHAGEGTPQVVLVQGEAGVGKTRLVTELLDAAPADTVMAVGHAVAMSHGSLPYGLAGDLLRSLVRAVGIDLVRAALGSQVRALVPLVPRLGSGDPETHVDELALLAAAQDLIAELATDRTLALVAEDAHWADRATLDLLVFLAHTLTQGRVLLVVTARDSVPEPIQARLVDLGRAANATHVQLNPLSEEDVADQVRLLAAGIPEADVADVYRLSDGIPLYVEQLVAAHTGHAPHPAALDLASSLNALPEESSRLLRLAALEARPFTTRSLAAVSGEPGDRAARAVDDGVAAGVLESAGRGSWRFHHELLRQAAVSSLSPSEEERGRRSWIPHLSEGRPGPDDLIAITDHWRHLPACREAFDAFVAAASASERVAATQETVELWRESIDVAVAAGDIAESDVAEVFARATFIPQSLDSKYRLVVAAERLEQPLSASFGAAVAMGRYAAAIFSDDVSSPPYSESELNELSSRLRASPATSATVAALIFMLYALNLTMQRAARNRVLEDLLEVADKLPEVRKNGVDQVLDWQIDCLDAPGDEWQRVELARHQLAAAGTRDRATQAYAHVVLAAALTNVGDLTTAVEHSAAALRLLPELGAQAHHLTATVGALESLYFLGRWDEALALVTPDGRELTLYPTVLIQLSRGNRQAADELIAAFPRARDGQESPSSHRRRFLLAQLEALRHELRDAAQARAFVLNGFAPRDVEASSSAAGEALLIASRLAWRPPVPAPNYVGFVRELVDHPAMSGRLKESYVQHARAHLARADGEDEPEGWLAAATTWEDIGAPFYAAECRFRAAESYLRVGATEAAASELGRALAAAEELGARPLSDEIRTTASHARLRLPGVEAPSAGSYGGLTPRELDVVQLLAEGRTNNEIGVALFMSPKTASVHVSRILQKLGARNRTEVAAIAHRNGLLDVAD